MTVQRSRAQLADAQVGVVGLGASGRAALEVLTTLGIGAVGVDGQEAAVTRAHADVGGRAALVHAQHAEDQIAALLPDGAHPADIIVVSPGIPQHSPIHQRAHAAGIPVWSEIELAWHLQAPRRPSAAPGASPAQSPAGESYAPWLALTGTNGKTTTVSMLSTILQAGGAHAPAIGNVGTPAVLLAAQGQADYLPAELSSFQLHATHSLAPLASVVLNVAPDHLDWHGSYAAYRADKARIYQRTTRACLYTPDPQTLTMVQNADVAEGAIAVGITLGAPAVGQLGIVDGVLCERAFEPSRWTAAQELATLEDLAHLAPQGRELPPHLLLDALVAAALARAAGIAPAQVRDGLRAYQPGAHRIATVATVGEVAFIDDSKATNAHAAAASLGGVERGRAVWVAGGVAKGARFDELIARRADRLRAVVLIGTDREPWRAALSAHAPQIPVVETDPQLRGRAVMESVVRAALDLAQPGDTVLLAPATASFDQFSSYADRGDAFATAAAALARQTRSEEHA